VTADERRPAKMNPILRLLLLVLGIAAGAVPLGLLLPDSAISALLAYYYPADQYNLTNPDLLLSWRWILAGACGVVVCILLAIPLAILRRRRWKAKQPVLPEAVQRVLAAASIEDSAGVAEACEEVARRCGDEAVPPLLQALEAAGDEGIRRHLAATLYRLGRVVTAETSLHLRR